jgi:PTS system glucitol/sorbitol-specific IIA component
MKYRTIVTRLGDMASELMAGGMLIVFDENAPEELAEVSMLHTMSRLWRDVRPGDTVLLANSEYAVTAVGSEANNTLRKMGHCTFKFEGASDAGLPGEIQLKGKCPPSLGPGDSFEVHFK